MSEEIEYIACDLAPNESLREFRRRARRPRRRWWQVRRPRDFVPG